MNPEASIVLQASVYIIPVLLAITMHEAAHGFAARLFGDDTAYRMGRVTLNPIKHIDLFGTIILPGILIILSTGFVFGYAKPVPVNPLNLKSRRRDFLVITASGPASNIVLAVGASLFLSAVPGGLGASEGMAGLLVTIGFAMLQLNVLLAVFNMLPIPPLDGGNVLAGVLPEAISSRYDRLVRPYGFFILILLMVTGTLSQLIGPPMSFLMGWLLP